MSLRPDWQTIRRRTLLHRPTALAAADGTCSCGRDVSADEPIVHLGAVAVREPDGTATVDLSGAEWCCLHCQAVPA